MQVLKFFVIWMTAVVLTGCAFNKPDPVVIKEKEYVYVTVPEALTESVKPPKPASREEYMALSVYKREAYLADYSIQLLGSVQMCNANLSSIRKLQGTINENRSGN